jgi:hypothetical protein
MAKLTKKQLYALYAPYWFYLSLLVIYIVASVAHAQVSSSYEFNGTLFIVLIFLSVVFRMIMDNQKNLLSKIEDLETKVFGPKKD